MHKARYQTAEVDLLEEAAQTRRAIEALAGACRAPPAGSAEAAARTRIETEVRSQLARITIGQPNWSLPAAKHGEAPPYTAEVTAGLDALAGRLRATLDERDALFGSINARYQALGHYVVLLRQVKQSLALLSEAAEAPTPVTAGDLLRLGREVQDDVRALQAALRQQQG